MWKWAMQGHPSKHVEFDVLVRIQNKVPWVVGDNSFRYQKRNGSRATGNKSSYGSGWEWTGRVKMENMCIRTHIHTDKKYEEIREREAISGKESACWYRRQWSWLIPGSKRSPGEGSGSLLQYSWLGNPMDRWAWWATVHGITRVRHELVTKQ